MKVRSNIILSLVASAILPLAIHAGEPTIVDHLNAEGVVTVIQPDGLNARLARVVSVEAEENVAEDEQSLAAVPKVKAGYRVQVFDDNNVRTAKQDAQSRKQMIESRFPLLNVYVSFNSPYWRVKVGDFATRSEAEAAMAEIRQAFPSMAKSLRIVRDRIKHQ